MSLVYAGVCSHGPGITARADRANPELRDAFYTNLDKMRKDNARVHFDTFRALLQIGHSSSKRRVLRRIALS